MTVSRLEAKYILAGNWELLKNLFDERDALQAEVHKWKHARISRLRVEAILSPYYGAQTQTSIDSITEKILDLEHDR